MSSLDHAKDGGTDDIRLNFFGGLVPCPSCCVAPFETQSLFDLQGAT